MVSTAQRSPTTLSYTAVKAVEDGESTVVALGARYAMWGTGQWAEVGSHEPINSKYEIKMLNHKLEF